jgi:hypothetical protein
MKSISLEKTWTQFKSYFAVAHRQHKHIQGESAATAGYHSANAAVGKTEDHFLKPKFTADRGVVATLTEANARLGNQLEDNSYEFSRWPWPWGT